MLINILFLHLSLTLVRRAAIMIVDNEEVAQGDWKMIEFVTVAFAGFMVTYLSAQAILSVFKPQEPLIPFPTRKD